jgi:hypothetical protein
MSILIVLAILAFITWNVFVQVSARQQTTISISGDVASARRAVYAAFSPTWALVEGKGEDNFRPKLRMRAPVLSVSYEPNEAGGSEVDIWCSHFKKRYGCMEHAQLAWRKKHAVARSLTQAQPALPQASNQQVTGNRGQQVAGEQASMQPEVGSSSVHNALSGRSTGHESPTSGATHMTGSRYSSPAEVAEYQRVRADNLTGEEQAAMRERDPQEYKAWLQTQLRHVPMSSEQKPDINGFREGDRFQLVQPFNGDTVSYEPGRTGTFLITNTAPAQIRIARGGFYEIFIDGPDGQLILVMNGDVERIPGHANVLYSDDGESFQIVRN